MLVRDEKNVPIVQLELMIISIFILKAGKEVDTAGIRLDGG